MALEISVSVRDQAVALNAQGRVAEAWSLLARNGDNYAASAHQVVSDPTSAYGQIVRNHWKAANADFSKFNAVAEDYQAKYLSSLGAGSTSGTVRLPSTTAIESSYIGALDENGVTRYAAVDAVIEAARRVPGKENELHWYEALKIEPGRFGPPAPEIGSLNPGQAAQTYYTTVGYTRETLLYTLNQDVNYFNNTIGSAEKAMEWHAQQMGAKGITTFQAGDLTFFYNEVTGNMATFDANGVGRAYVDGQRLSINPNNWRLDPASKQYQYNTDGTWRVAEANGANADITLASNGMSADTVDIQTTSAASGPHTLIDFDQGSTNPWSTDVKVYDAANGLDWQRTDYDVAVGGHRVETDYDQASAAPWSATSTLYDNRDQADFRTQWNDDNTRVETDWDQADTNDGWDVTVTAYDTESRLDARNVWSDTGSLTTTDWDQLDTGGWDHIINAWASGDTTGPLVSSIVDFDGIGTGSTETRWDVANAQGWESVTNNWTGDDGGGLLSRSVQDLDGANTGSL